VAVDGPIADIFIKQQMINATAKSLKNKKTTVTLL
jgi:hypothetical protein